MQPYIEPSIPCPTINFFPVSLLFPLLDEFLGMRLGFSHFLELLDTPFSTITERKPTTMNQSFNPEAVFFWVPKGACLLVFDRSFQIFLPIALSSTFSSVPLLWDGFFFPIRPPRSGRIFLPAPDVSLLGESAACREREATKKAFPPQTKHTNLFLPFKSKGKSSSLLFASLSVLAAPSYAAELCFPSRPLGIFAARISVITRPPFPFERWRPSSFLLAQWDRPDFYSSRGRRGRAFSPLTISLLWSEKISHLP